VKQRILIIVLIVLVLAGAGALLATKLEWVETPIEIGPSGEARLNPLYACEKLFDELGLPAQSVAYLGAPPAEDHVMVLRNTGRYLAPPVIERLIAWIERGGNLILLFPSSSELLDEIEDDLDEGRFELPIARELGVNCILDEGEKGLLHVDLGQGRARALAARPLRLSRIRSARPTSPRPTRCTRAS
jgi:hypothetical protein